MSSQVSAPVSTTVIALDVSGIGADRAGANAGFEALFAVTHGLGFAVPGTEAMNSTVTLAPDADLSSALRRLAVAIAEFDGAASPARIRAMVHYGVVFRTESAGQVSYVGSAVRSTQSALRRAPNDGSIMATRDFSVYAAKIANLPFRLEAMSGGAGAEGTCHLVFAGKVAPAQSGAGQLASSDPAFVEFVKRRMAEEIGPFASALVDRALRTTAVAAQLITTLSGDIDEPVARKRFEDDVLSFIKDKARGA